MPDWRPTLGALLTGHDTRFRLWAPGHRAVELVLERDPARPRPLMHDGSGYWATAFDDVRPGDRYRYRLNREGAQTFPDPASRFQPAGVHGPSEVVDAASFQWTDDAWRPHGLADLTFYELHVGTFTTAGTFRGVIDRIDHLARLGITAIELMPVGDFPGDRNWGYDVAAMFAPSRAYGRPDDLRALVDAAHARGLSVFLDVIYNHVGPDGAYLGVFSPQYFNHARSTPWGAAMNLDGPGAADVRRFFVENALHWIREYHVDGLRLDATHALHDDSARHFLAELTSTVHEQAGRPVCVVAEDHRNLAQLIRDPRDGGFGVDAVWADDFHHQVRVHVAHDHEGYFADYRGTAADLAVTLTKGWYYTGEPTRSSGTPRGTDPGGLPPQRFVVCIQNHDQIGNRADGARLNHEIDPATFRAASTLLLMAPETPLLFMGQEWAATSPFLFFTDHHGELGERVTEGRRSEFSSFRAFADPERRREIPDPQAASTFERSRLAWEEIPQSPHREVLRLYRLLLALRRDIMSPELRRGDFDVTVLDAGTVAVTLPKASVIVRLSGSGTVPCVAGAAASIIFTTEHPDVADDARPIRFAGDRVTFERPGALILSTCLAPRLSITGGSSISHTGGGPHGDADD